MWHDRLVRELAIVLAIKLTVLYLIWRAFFSSPSPLPDETEMERVLLHPSSVVNSNK